MALEKIIQVLVIVVLFCSAAATFAFGVFIILSNTVSPLVVNLGTFVCIVALVIFGIAIAIILDIR